MNTEIANARRVQYPACSSNACKEGRKDCPTKQACFLPLDDDLAQNKDIWEARVIAFFCVLTLLWVLASAFV